MSHDDHQKWHWQEGNKYAVEAMKTLLLLNGGSAVALLTFFGNWKGAAVTTPMRSIGAAVLCFALGALCAALSFIGAYFTQLEYGNRDNIKSSRLHGATYVPVLASIGFFVIGLLFGRCSLPA